MNKKQLAAMFAVFSIIATVGTAMLWVLGGFASGVEAGVYWGVLMMIGPASYGFAMLLLCIIDKLE